MGTVPARPGGRTRLLIVADEKPLLLCFEFWASEYTVAAGSGVIVRFDDKGPPIEVVHGPDGITFFSSGAHPEIWTRNGEPLPELNGSMPMSSAMTRPLPPSDHPDPADG